MPGVSGTHDTYTGDEVTADTTAAVYGESEGMGKLLNLHPARTVRRAPPGNLASDVFSGLPNLANRKGLGFKDLFDALVWVCGGSMGMDGEEQRGYPT